MRLTRKSLMVMGFDALFTSSDFTYTGTYTWIDEGTVNRKTSYRIKFLTSGTFTPKKAIRIDLFLVGGGGGGGYGYNNYAGAGGGGGYATTVRAVNLLANQAYTITIGTGGIQGIDNEHPSGSGGSSTAFGYSASGGQPGGGGGYSNHNGGNGGSGGGGSAYSNATAGAGGSDGNDGQTFGGAGGAGQHTTTREFGEGSGTLYSGGGGAGAYTSHNGAGGDGGGGGGGYNSSQYGATAGTNNLGGGGGGGGAQQHEGCVGGSGICVIRNKRS